MRNTPKRIFIDMKCKWLNVLLNHFALVLNECGLLSADVHIGKSIDDTNDFGGTTRGILFISDSFMNMEYVISHKIMNYIGN